MLAHSKEAFSIRPMGKPASPSKAQRLNDEPTPFDGPVPAG